MSYRTAKTKKFVSAHIGCGWDYFVTKNGPEDFCVWSERWRYGRTPDYHFMGKAKTAIEAIHIVWDVLAKEFGEEIPKTVDEATERKGFKYMTKMHTRPVSFERINKLLRVVNDKIETDYEG